MKAFLNTNCLGFCNILVLALFAMASAQSDKVKVAEIKPDPVHVVDNNPGYVHVVDNNPPTDFVINNPDPAFSRPTGQYEPISNGHTFVDSSATRPPYPYKQYDNAYARGGK